ncbi:Bax inhibitor-1/YccA family protein [Romboutsia sp. 1001285H_161024_C4]|uniref:Bax inhibitor-1/YccA family protein n=1 Tax=Romboutsia sp. 1001285H_161024_C4 TaxID=2787109 RepID=UPI00189C52D8|nr:Bax inhibitor-1 family protein [Romboutsia sp. 1001285H_161024_C4]
MHKEITNPMADIFKYLAISILFMFIGFAFGQAFIPISVVQVANLILPFLIIGLLIMAILSKKSIIPRSFSMNYVYLFTFIDGILLYPLLSFYLQSLGTSIVINALLGTCILFGILAFISYRKKAGHYLGIGSILFAGLISLLPLCIINIFIGSQTLNILYSVLGILIFSGYILYDISLIKYDIESGNIISKNDLSIHVLNLYLDFVNILLDLLNLIYEFKD